VLIINSLLILLIFLFAGFGPLHGFDENLFHLQQIFFTDHFTLVDTSQQE
jgi:hypothetical protein